MHKESSSTYTCDTQAETKDVCLCPLEGIIETISKKWALQIIAAIGNSQRLRFGEVKESLREISPKTLADRLKELAEAGLIRREAFAEIPPRVEYALTEDGKQLRKAMIPLMNWASSRT